MSRSELSTLRKVVVILGHERRLRWALVVMLAVGVTAVEAIGALLIFVLLGLVAAPNSAIEVPVLGDLQNLQGDMDRERFIVLVAIAVVVFFVFRGFALILQMYVQSRLANNAGARLATRLLETYLSMPYVVHVRRNSAELIRNAHESVNAVTAEVIKPGVQLISNLVLALGLVTMLALTSPLATLLAILVLGPVVLVITRVIQPRLKALGRKRQTMARDSLAILQQSLHGIRDLVLYGSQDFFLTKFKRRKRSAARVNYLSRSLQELTPVLIETASVGFIAGFFVLTVTTQASPEEGLAVLGLFAYATIRLQPALYKIVQGINSIRFAGAAVDDIYGDLQLSQEGEGSSRRDGASQPASQSVLRGLRVQLESVRFQYTADGPLVLRGVDLTIEPGESVGIVGPTGSGKSTLVDLITGLLDPSSGNVTIGGEDLRRCRVAWQRSLGVVPQTIFMLDDTIRRNVALGVKDAQIDDDQVWAALELAQLSAFVVELAGGLDATVGERAIQLSGGQRQRLAIARALYRDPAVLIFDEGTSALDNTTEAEFISALESLYGKRTIIAVAHRLSTVRKMDRILVIEHGKISDAGSYEELIKRSSHFARAGSPRS
jgi:ATP-binding cassette, subfamily B, bacterial PglK